MTKKEYTAIFKARIALELLKEEKTMAQISADYGVPPRTLYDWRAQALAGLPTIFSHREGQAAHAQQLEELALEISRLIMQLHWLKMHLPLGLSTLSAEPTAEGSVTLDRHELRSGPDA